MAQSPRSLANLKPLKPGQVLNPEGHNQYTCQREAFLAFNEAAKEARGDKTKMRAFVDAAWEMAMEGKEPGFSFIGKRVLPYVEQHDISVLDAADDGIVDRLAAVIRARKGNGSDTSPTALRPEDDQ